MLPDDTKNGLISGDGGAPIRHIMITLHASAGIFCLLSICAVATRTRQTKQERPRKRLSQNRTHAAPTESLLNHHAGAVSRSLQAKCADSC